MVSPAVTLRSIRWNATDVIRPTLAVVIAVVVGGLLLVQLIEPEVYERSHAIENATLVVAAFTTLLCVRIALATRVTLLANGVRVVNPYSRYVVPFDQIEAVTLDAKGPYRLPVARLELRGGRHIRLLAVSVEMVDELLDLLEAHVA